MSNNANYICTRMTLKNNSNNNLPSPTMWDALLRTNEVNEVLMHSEIGSDDTQSVTWESGSGGNSRKQIQFSGKCGVGLFLYFIYFYILNVLKIISKHSKEIKRKIQDMPVLLSSRQK